TNDTRVCRARIIAASNVDLEQAAARERFRQYLFYRLNVLTFYLPPLRDRPRDVACRALDMAARYGSRFGRGPLGVSPAALAALAAFAWPGNIRQLENVMQQAALLGAGPELLPEHLPALVRDAAAAPRPVPAPGEPAAVAP